MSKAAARALALICTGAVLLAGCAAPPPQDPPDPGCAGVEGYPELPGTTVAMTVADRADAYTRSLAAFTACTGIAVEVREGPAPSSALVADGGAPDLAGLPTPAALATLVRETGAVVPLPQQAATNVERYLPDGLVSAGGVDGTLYAAPLDSDVVGLVRYPPRVLAERGYAVPTSWDELIALSDRIVADGGIPWCAPPTAAPLTDLLAAAVLGESGPQVYDAWLRHDIPADDGRVARALDRLGAVLRNPAYLGGGPPAPAGSCLLQAGVTREDLPADAAPDGDVFAFPLPAIDPAAPTVLATTAFLAAFDDRPEVDAVQAYLSSPEWAAEMAAATPDGGWVTADNAVDPAALAQPLDRLLAGVLRDDRSVVRLEAGTLLPEAVGSGSLPDALSAWVTGTSTTDALGAVERSWPRDRP